MSNLLGMMWTGVSGLNAAQTGISVTGNNMANMKTENYSKQTVEFVTKKPQYTYNGAIGKGVDVQSIRREYDDLLAKSVRNSNSNYQYYNSMSTTLKNAMLYFNELKSGSGLGDALKDYFNAWQDLSNSAPDETSESLTKRTVLVEAADTLAIKIRDGYQYLEDARTQCDTNIQTEVDAINEITTQLAQLNKEIVSAEAMGQPANELRDMRDGLLDDLAEKTQISTYLREDGSVSVYMNGQTLVDNGTAHILFTEKDPENGNHLKIMWKTDNPNSKPIDMTSFMKGGVIAAQLEVRDNQLKQYQTDLDEMAKKVIEETNRIHATGVGLDKATEYTGKTQVINPEYPLNSTEGGLPYEVKSGSFDINISTPTGKTNNKGNEIYDTKKITIQVNASDTLKTVLEKINQQGANYVNASINLDNTVTIKAASGSYIAFGEDTSDFLMATGMNSFFSGSSAKDISIEASVKENPRLIAASEFGAEGDNTNALKIAQLQTTSFSTTKGDVTFSAFYGYFIGEMSSAKSQADTFTTTTEMSYSELSTQLMSIRGVSEEEEQVNLVLYQRMYEANSRYINVIDEMLNTLINSLGSAGR
ncbi:MAG: flagellar hook-associated protein FlgK [Mucispirillum sp.]|nr:flagellar hook-associated protein FlgK [Mucispirillum sp.]